MVCHFKDYKILNAGKSNPENSTVFSKTAGATYSIFKDFEGVEVHEDGTIEVSNTTEEALLQYADPSYGSATMLRSSFKTEDKSIAKAKLYVTSMGSNEVYINGERVSEDWFAPGATQFRETLGYYAYDVTAHMAQGDNVIGALVFPGWYTGYMTYTTTNYNFFGDTEALLAKLVITYEDGSEQTVVTDPDTWKIFTEGPVEYGSFFQGERYNALKEEHIAVDGKINGWATTAYDDSKWSNAEEVQSRDWIDFEIVSRYDRPVRVVENLQATKVMEVHSEDERTYTYNMGVNMVGVPSITVPQGWLKKGDTVILRYGEQVYPGLEGDEPQYIDRYG